MQQHFPDGLERIFSGPVLHVKRSTQHFIELLYKYPYYSLLSVTLIGVPLSNQSVLIAETLHIVHFVGMGI